MADLAACTIAAKPMLASARVVARSFRRHHPGVPFHVLLADEPDGAPDATAEPYELVRLDDLDLPEPARFRFRYAQQPLSYAATPYLLDHLLDRGYRRLLLIKQESLVLGDLTPVARLLDEDAVVLTPHLLSPLDGADAAERERIILLSGIYNLGFCGVSAAPAGRAFLAWWKDRVREHCLHAVDRGMHFEQRWADLVPGLFRGVHILRDPGTNVGHWSFPERVVRVDGDAVTADGHPCRLFRFSGYDAEDPDSVTRYHGRLAMEDLGDAAKVFERYRRELAAAGHAECRRLPYAYGCFDNGVEIPDDARRTYVELGDAARRFGDPFATAGPDSLWWWLTAPGDGDAPLTRLWSAVVGRRPDVRAAFPDPGGRDRAAFADWTTRFGRGEHGIAEALPVFAS
jgi:hypothetical protein